MSARGTRAIDVLRRAGVAHAVREYEPGPPGSARRVGAATRPAYGEEAAAALGVEPGRVFKTLVVAVDGRLVLAIVAVAAELDLKRLADALGGRRALLADPAEAERATGYVVGGISPLGGRRTLPVVLDVAAMRQATVFVSSGRRGLQVELAPGDLARLSTATLAPIARPR
jgi:Cys-tRNA(Pro)/Cys-tRNA(Cys) deacylase